MIFTRSEILDLNCLILFDIQICQLIAENTCFSVCDIVILVVNLSVDCYFESLCLRFSISAFNRLCDFERTECLLLIGKCNFRYSSAVLVVCIVFSGSIFGNDRIAILNNEVTGLFISLNGDNDLIDTLIVNNVFFLFGCILGNQIGICACRIEFDIIKSKLCGSVIALFCRSHCFSCRILRQRSILCHSFDIKLEFAFVN